ncbi:MAG TPA: response regulator transcription factor [Mycobacteriales bacterium]|nr:response regulator transcription factor [Mycobacteriales bacterium]
MSEESAIRVVLADDQTLVREGLALMLSLVDGIDVVGMGVDGEQAVALVESESPDVALLDLRMPRVDGVEATRRIRETAPAVQVVVLTTYADDESVFAALRAGARGYLTKDASSEEIERAIRDAVAGRTRLDPAVQERLVELVTTGAAAGTVPASVPPGGPLTERETEVVRLMAEGLTNRQIAARLFVTEATVKTHVNNVFGKLDVGDRAAAVAWAFRAGIATT